MSLTRTTALVDGWQLASTAAGSVAAPAGLAAAAPQWQAAVVPGTVASALRPDLEAPARYDADDWWYRTTFAMPSGCAGTRHFLRFDGLATLAEAWLNGERILDSRNMFRGHRVDVSGRLRDVNQLVIRFASLDAALAEKRDRPRWQTQLVEHANLRWFRTTLLGRMPGWNPAVTPVGPWQPVSLECVEQVEIASLNVQARVEGGMARVLVRAAASRLDGKPLEGARLRVGDSVHALDILQGEDARIHGEVEVPGAPLWWPHTHGNPRRVRCALELLVDGAWLTVECGMLGFKKVAFESREGRLEFLVNGVPVFCRGAVWTTMDILALRAERGALRAALETARDAGLNMLRVGGTMHYESDDFYALCDELGILVWQDFMFANMDYPVADREFRAEVEAEVRHQLGRLHRHACVVAYCGGSEIAQQAAMMGMPADQWTNEFFTEALPRLCAEEHGGIPYFPSTPWGGALPFHVGSGVAHYYGVGAYRRPLADVKTARVKFTTECLGFSNVPEPANLALIGGRALPSHHPRWKARVPRDNGAGWDFEDIRDHYLKELFKVDPGELRARDIERYHQLSRVVTGEVMQRVFAEWRTPHNRCGGALVWNFRDVWPGAGWGITDSSGAPKAALWFLKRAWARHAAFFTDEGLDGLAVHMVNDTPQTLDATLELEMYRDGRVMTASVRAPVLVPPRGATSRYADALLGYFTDSTNAYRFGPPQHDVVAVRLRANASGEILGEDFYFPQGLALPMQRAASIRADVERRADGRIAVTLSGDAFLQAVSVSCEGYRPDDDYFHVAPNRDKRIVFTPLAGPARAFRAWLQPLNVSEAIAVRLDAPQAGTTSNATERRS